MDWHGVRIAVQAKRYDNKNVGNAAVQEVVAALKYYKCCEGWVITNSNYTANAMDLAAKNGVRLLDGRHLAHIEKHLRDLGPIASKASGRTVLGFS